MAGSVKNTSISETYVGSQLRIREHLHVTRPVIKHTISDGSVALDGYLIKGWGGSFVDKEKRIMWEPTSLSSARSCQILMVFQEIKSYIHSEWAQHTVWKLFSGHVEVQLVGALAINRRAHLRFSQSLTAYGKIILIPDQPSSRMMMHAIYSAI
jgi:hypothetical protein